MSALTPDNQIRRLTRFALECALENGYFDISGLYCLSDRAIAEDIATHFSDLDEESPDTILPYVSEWRKEHLQ